MIFICTSETKSSHSVYNPQTKRITSAHKNAYRSNLKTGSSSESKLPEISNLESYTKLTSMETDSLKALYH